MFLVLWFFGKLLDKRNVSVYGDNMTKKTEEKKAKRLSDAKLFALADAYEEAHRAEGTAKKEKSTAGKAIITEMISRKSSAIESKEFGGFTRITLVQPSSVEYDDKGIWNALTPTQRREAFDANVNLNALSKEARKRVMEVLTKEERAAVTTHALNTERMAQAVQDGKIEAKIVADNSHIKQIAPSIRISHGSD